MILESWPTEVRLRARLFTAGSGPYGIEVVTTKLERTLAFLLLPALDLAALPQDAREAFTLDVELPCLHPFARRCMRCQAGLSSISKLDGEMLEVVIAIHKMRFIPVAERAMRAAAAGPGSERIQ